jgi:ATP-dependent helicase YprA (DUF1998 family)
MSIENIRRLKEQAKLPKQKKIYRIPYVSAKKKEQMKEEKAIRVAGGNEMDRWFEARRIEMTGWCAHCGDPSCKNNDKYFKFSIAHILPKNLFKSVKSHPLNWVELCFWNKSHHTNFDNKTLDIMELNCFNEVIEKFVAIYPYIVPKERKYIPDVLLQYVNIDL